MGDSTHSLQFIETPVFTQQIQALVEDEDYRRLQELLIAAPELGELIKGGGGIRKVRMPRQGKGKRSGLRVIYYFKRDQETIFMLFAYAKSAKTDLSPREVAVLRRLIKAI
jgi:hypothetical protein